MAFPVGSLLIPSDGLDNPTPFGVVISPTDGSFIGKSALGAAEDGAITAFGRFALLVSTDSDGSGLFGHVTAVNVYDLDLTLIGSFVPPSFPSALFSSINTDWAHTFYYASNDNGVRTVSDAAVAGATTWNLNSTIPGGGSVSPMAPSRDGTILYYGDNRGVAYPPGANGSPLHRWDLINNVALSDLLPGELGAFQGLNLLVLPNGNFIVLYVTLILGGPDTHHVRQYDPTGALIQTYDLGVHAEDFDNVQLALDPSDATIFWVRTFPDSSGDTSTFSKIRLSDGAVLLTFVVTDNVLGGPPPVPHGVPASCPFLVLATGSPIPPTPPPCGPVTDVTIGCANDLPVAPASGGVGCATDVPTSPLRSAA
jgi:hypothetical protein